MTYIQFDAPKSSSHPPKDGPIKGALAKAFGKFLTTIIPKANPDFDGKISEVQYWLVECDSATGIPEREIGIDKEGRVILKMPFKENYGYWTDNHLLLTDFKEHFSVSEISKESFEHSWSQFDKMSDFSIEISDFEILSTGVDGGHVYLTSEIRYNGQLRRLVVYFADKSDEQKIKRNQRIRIEGQLLDDGVQQSLSLLDARIID